MDDDVIAMNGGTCEPVPAEYDSDIVGGFVGGLSAHYGLTHIHIVTAGAYSAYHIDSVWSTVDDAEARCDFLNAGRSQWEADARVKTWPLDSIKPTDEHWTARAGITAEGEVLWRHEAALQDEGPELGRFGASTWVHRMCSELVIDCSMPSAEQCEKVLSETIARLKVAIDQGQTLAELADKEHF